MQDHITRQTPIAPVLGRIHRVGIMNKVPAGGAQAATNTATQTNQKLGKVEKKSGNLF